MNATQAGSRSQIQTVLHSTQNPLRPFLVEGLASQRSRSPSADEWIRDRYDRQASKMEQEKKLYERRSTRGRLNRQDGTDLWAQKLQLDELDLFDKREMDRGAFGRIGRHTEP